MARSAYDLDTPRDAVGWWDRALCRGREAMFFTTFYPVAAQAVHLCSHCPVRAACEKDRREPIGCVQAGVWFGDRNGVARKYQPRDPGCGPWCAHLRGIRG